VVQGPGDPARAIFNQARMTKKELTILGLFVLGALLIPGISSGSVQAVEIVLKPFLVAREGFSPTPVWDYSQWSWGYGTAAGYDKNKKPPGTISESQAWREAMEVIQDHYSVLSSLITRPLNQYQWSALLSFAYNTGIANAKKLVPYVNAGSAAALFTKMRQFVYAGGKLNQGLVARREKEIALYQGNVPAGRQELMVEVIERIHPDLIGEYAY